MILRSYACGRWYEAPDGFVEIPSAVDGRVVARSSTQGLDYGAMVRYARDVAGPPLRRLTFHERAAALKDVAVLLGERKHEFYELSYDTGATTLDHAFDIDGGIGTLHAYAGRARRELPDERFALDGELEPLGKSGTFAARHILTPLHGVAVFVNAYNFPCWGFLEKFAPAFLAGMPCIVKPATATAYVTHAVVAAIVAADVLPAGSVQLVAGDAGDLLDHLDSQDVLAFTGSFETSLSLRAHPVVAEKAVRFVAERDSLNAAVLGPDAGPGTPEFDLFVREVVREMTTKAGQKCTAIRRAFVPRAWYGAAADALRTALGAVVVGDPRRETTQMGALAGLAQRDAVRASIAALAREASLLFGDPAHVAVDGADAVTGAFMSPILLGCETPLQADAVHRVEAFGPVATLMPYDSLPEAIALVRRGGGSLVASVYTHDDVAAQRLVFGIGAYHGRVIVIDRDDAAEHTGHGAPLPNLVHGGPGRAGGGEELGGLRGVYHYMQRTALQGSPARIAALVNTWSRGASEVATSQHPFRRTYDELVIGETIHTATRAVTLADIEQFASFTGDTFYAHMDEAAARANPFFPGRVAHGYLLLSFAAGLFVDPEPGPVLANYGIDALRFFKPVQPGDTMGVRLTVKAKVPRKAGYGEVRWDVEITNQHGESVARYDLLTMNATATRARVPVAAAGG